MERCFDMHAHLLPGVDDGAVDMDMALGMLAMYQRQGVTDIMVTPHSYAFFEEAELAREQFRLLCEAAKAHFPEIRLYLGAEVLFTLWDLEENMDALRTGVLPSLSGTKYVLTEFFPDERRTAILQTIRRLTEEGWIPVIAHAERIRPALTDMTFVRELTDMGALVQINAYSLEKESDLTIRLTARQLLAEGLVDFVGSDAHRTYHRPPDVADGLRYIREHCSHAQDILSGHALRAFG